MILPCNGRKEFISQYTNCNNKDLRLVSLKKYYCILSNKAFPFLRGYRRLLCNAVKNAIQIRFDASRNGKAPPKRDLRSHTSAAGIFELASRIRPTTVSVAFRAIIGRRLTKNTRARRKRAKSEHTNPTGETVPWNFFSAIDHHAVDTITYSDGLLRLVHIGGRSRHKKNFTPFGNART